MEMAESKALTYLREAELNLEREEGRNRERAIALTHIQTAILWLTKDETEKNFEESRQALYKAVKKDGDRHD